MNGLSDWAIEVLNTLGYGTGDILYEDISSLRQRLQGVLDGSEIIMELYDHSLEDVAELLRELDSISYGKRGGRIMRRDPVRSRVERGVRTRKQNMEKFLKSRGVERADSSVFRKSTNWPATSQQVQELFEWSHEPMFIDMIPFIKAEEYPPNPYYNIESDDIEYKVLTEDNPDFAKVMKEFTRSVLPTATSGYGPESLQAVFKDVSDLVDDQVIADFYWEGLQKMWGGLSRASGDSLLLATQKRATSLKSASERKEAMEKSNRKPVSKSTFPISTERIIRKLGYEVEADTLRKGEHLTYGQYENVISALQASKVHGTEANASTERITKCLSDVRAAQDAAIAKTEQNQFLNDFLFTGLTRSDESSLEQELYMGRLSE